MTEVLNASAATSTDVQSTDTAGGGGSLHISTTKTTYRNYGGFDEKGKAKGVTKKDEQGNPVFTENYATLSETQTKKNWNAQEEKGAVVLSQNDFLFYSLTDLAGFDSLVPDAAQRLYIVQKGIDAIQTAAANQKMAELAEKKTVEDPDVFLYNDDTIDLKEAINRPPQKKNLTPEEKFKRAVSELSVMDPTKAFAMLEKLRLEMIQQISAGAEVEG